MSKNSDFSSSWIKYSDYELKTIEEETYIKPIHTSKYEHYNPFDVKDKILVDLLMIGRLIGISETEVANKKVIEFVKNYGLLGFLAYTPLNSNILMQKNVYLPKGNDIIGKETISTKDYINLFLKCDDKKIIQLHEMKNNSYSVSFSNEMNPTMLLNKPLEYGIVFSKGYSEKLSWILKYAEHLYLEFFSIERYYLFDEPQEKKVADIYIKTLKPYNISCEIALNEKPDLKWDFNSLKLALDTMFVLEMTAEKKKLKICKKCWNPFYSENIKAEYCSPQCRNQANVYKSRNKNK